MKEGKEEVEMRGSCPELMNEEGERIMEETGRGWREGREWDCGTGVKKRPEKG